MLFSQVFYNQIITDYFLAEFIRKIWSISNGLISHLQYNYSEAFANPFQIWLSDSRSRLISHRHGILSILCDIKG